MVDEAHITTFAVLPEWRRRGIGGRLMLELMRLAGELGARVVTLEVRLSNQPARALYRRFGFRPGRHPAALLLGQRRGRADHDHDPSCRSPEMDAARWPTLAQDAMATAVIERSQDGQRAASSRSRPRATRPPWPSSRTAGGSSPTSSPARSRSTRATGGIVPEVAARAHLRWMIPVLEEARSEAGIDDWSELDAIAVTEGPGLAGSLLVGHHDGQDAGLGARPAAGAGQPPRGPHLRRVAARSRTRTRSRRPSSRSWPSSSAAATRSWSR